MSSSLVCKICNHFENVTDPRKNRGQNFPLVEIVFLALCGSICDCNHWSDVERFGKAKLAWLRQHFPFENGIPSHDTFSRVFSRLDTLQFYATLKSWAQEMAHKLTGKTIAMDGKTLCGSHDRANGKSVLHSVSAWICELKMCIGLNSVADKSNEIPAVQELIDLLDLAGATVTTDAMHCQVETAQKIVNQQADYVLTVKGNQEKLYEEIDQTLVQAHDDEHPSLRTYKKKEKNRNRCEVREVSVLPIPKGSPLFERWPGIQTIGSIYRRREVNGKLEEEQNFFISSLPCKVREMYRHLRSPWSIENSQHHLLDVTFSEDASRIRKGNGPEIASVFRRLALNILQQDTSIKDNVRGKRKRCGWCEKSLEKLIAGFSGN
jgi:predicted transposase YbfD/YdcC